MKNDKRTAFTLVELLVVVAIIGILIGMLLPAIQQVRASAQRIACANKMRQLGLALHNYESSHMEFPVNQVGPGKSDGDGGYEAGNYSWLVPLLPFVEQDNLHSQFDLTINNGDGSKFTMSDTHPNAAAAATVVDLFLCPSDMTAGDNLWMGSANPASSSYVANIGWPSAATGFSGEKRPRVFNGVIPLENPSSPVDWHGNSKAGFLNITDGTSNTAMVSERLIQTGVTLREIRSSDLRVKSAHVVPRRDEPLASIASRLEASIDPHVIESAYIGRSWSTGYTLTAPTYVHLLAPNTRIGHYSQTTRDGDFLINPSSRHTGGINLVRADASVSFISDEIESEAWWALGARDDGQVFSDN